MKNKSLHLFLFITSFLYAIQSPAQNNYRRVDWLHGFGGFDNTKLERYSTSFGGANGERQMTSNITSYEVLGSITDIANGISIPSAASNICIGHSLGGIVCRNFEETGSPGSSNEAGGVITIHSPNQGASMATSVNNGQAPQFLSYVATTFTNAINSLFSVFGNGATVVSSVISTINNIIDVLNAILSAFLTEITGEQVGDVIQHVGELESPTASQINGQIAGVFNLINNQNTATIIDDLDPATSNFISNLNGSNSVPRIEIYGHEANHELLRLGCSLRTKVWTSPLATNTAYPDNCILQYALLAQNASGAVQMALIARLHTTFFWRHRKKRDILAAMGNVIRLDPLLDGGLEAGWAGLLGSQWETVTTTQTGFSQQCQAQESLYSDAIAGLMAQYQQCKNTGGSNCDFYLNQANAIQYQLNALQTDPNCIETVTTTVSMPSSLNDGFILEADMKSGSALATYQNAGVGVNHMEALNHPETWNNLNEVFDSQTFFNTPPR